MGPVSTSCCKLSLLTDLGFGAWHRNLKGLRQNTYHGMHLRFYTRLGIKQYLLIDHPSFIQLIHSPFLDGRNSMNLHLWPVTICPFYSMIVSSRYTARDQMLDTIDARRLLWEISHGAQLPGSTSSLSFTSREEHQKWACHSCQPISHRIHHPLPPATLAS